ncbi:hypothetical protein BV20DRAFT_960067 [Pilatotrama ljubarskyi]|nr:hypothetical protein BV20DRAFT_960067 [Pilatotrama ljubarskyi]
MVRWIRRHLRVLAAVEIAVSHSANLTAIEWCSPHSPSLDHTSLGHCTSPPSHRPRVRCQTKAAKPLGTRSSESVWEESGATALVLYASQGVRVLRCRAARSGHTEPQRTAASSYLSFIQCTPTAALQPSDACCVRHEALPINAKSARTRRRPRPRDVGIPKRGRPSSRCAPRYTTVSAPARPELARRSMTMRAATEPLKRRAPYAVRASRRLRIGHGRYHAMNSRGRPTRRYVPGHTPCS